MKKYCEECGREVETKIITKKESYNVCGEVIEVDAQVLICLDCGEEFFCEELDNETLVTAYNEYRRKHKLLLPEEIREVREQYGLSQRAFAKLLNWGDKTSCRYENGSIQDKAHNSLLLFLREPENMRTYLTENAALSDEELIVLEKIYEKFTDFGSVDISNYSHKEKGYCATKQGEIISYAYAKDIQLNSLMTKWKYFNLSYSLTNGKPE